MLLIAFFQWWYGPGWKRQFTDYAQRMRRVSDTFSIAILLKTLFAPWKQIVKLPTPDQSFGTKWQAFIDNLVSRTVGFFVRIFTLIAGIIATVFIALVGLILVLLWPFIPLVPFALVAVTLGSS